MASSRCFLLPRTAPRAVVSQTTPPGRARLARSAAARQVTSQVCACLSRCPGRFPARRCWSRPTGTSCTPGPRNRSRCRAGEAPRILGGRDELAGGTWLAVNSAGVLAGLTNQPSASRDPAKRSRGELPLRFAAYQDAATAVAEVCGRLDLADYNPCWLLVGDRDTLFSIDLTGSPTACRAGAAARPVTYWRTRRCAATRPRGSGWLALADAALAAAGDGAERGRPGHRALRPANPRPGRCRRCPAGCPGRPSHRPPACTPGRTGPARR